MISPRQLLFGSSEVPFAAVPLHHNEIGERVYLQTSASHALLDVTGRHWIVCSDPFMIAVWMNEPFKFDALQHRIFVMLDNRNVGHIELEFTDRKSFPEGRVVLFKCVKAAPRHSTYIHRQLMLFYLRLAQKTGTSRDIANYCVTYSYPRNVVLVSFRDDEYFNIFPMDFQGHVPGANRYILGLRKTNIALQKIVRRKQIVVCKVPATKQEIIYQLGKHHGSTPPSIDKLPFSCRSSEHFSFPVPDFSFEYLEIELDDFQTLGSHMLMVGRVANRVTGSSPERQLHHIHCMHIAHKERNTNKSD
jgi:flavin reductase (DIM6/NTAB) family NADH-FMN oxidoreductase RutF